MSILFMKSRFNYGVFAGYEWQAGRIQLTALNLNIKCIDLEVEMKKKWVLVIFLFGFFLNVSVSAMEFQHIGFEAMSMGGAGVASASGSYAAYYNPALLPEHKHSTTASLSAFYRHREVNLAESIDTLADIDIEDTFEQLKNIGFAGGTPGAELQQDAAAIKAELQRLTGRNGLQLMPGGALGIQTGSFGFGAYMISEATATGVVDENRMAFVAEENGMYIKYDTTTNTYSSSNQAEYEATSLEYATDEAHTTTYVQLDGLAYIEIPIAYGHRFNTPLGRLNLGGAFKFMPGYTFEMDSIAIDTESEQLEDELEDAYESDSAFGVDLGLLYKPAILKKLSLGLVGKNLNTPEFETKSGRTLEVDPQIRCGLAYEFNDKITLAMDADLTNNDTFIPDYASQYVGGGINFHPASWVCIRAGIAKNIQESDEGTILTGGVGFGTKWLQMDVAAQYGTETGYVDGEEVPRVASAQFSIVSKWN